MILLQLNDLHKIITNSNQELKIVYKYDVCENIFKERNKKKLEVKI